MRIAFDVSSVPLSPDLVALVDILVVNAIEAEMMGSDPVLSLASAETAAKRLAEQFETVIVTAGSKGLAAVMSGDVDFSLPGEVVQVVSSHGAGDAFIGTLCAVLRRGLTLREACKDASHAAAQHVSAVG